MPIEWIGGRRTTYEAFVRTSAIIVQGSPDDDDDDTRKMPARLPAHADTSEERRTARRIGDREKAWLERWAILFGAIHKVLGSFFHPSGH